MLAPFNTVAPLAPVRTAAPASDLVSLDEARVHLRVDDGDEDVLIAGLIAAATAHLDGWSGILGRALINQTWAQSYAGFCDPLRLPLAPVSSITSVTYYDGGNVQQTLDPSVYQLLTDTYSPKVIRQPTQVWPVTYCREDAVTVTFVAGYGATASSVPAAIRHAMLLLIGSWFENREAVSDGVPYAELPFAIRALISPYRRVGF